MRYGSLSDHFTGIIAKRLSAVEVDPARSHQHEFNGTSALRKLLGNETFIERNSRFLWLGGENEGISDDAPVSWYDARAAHPTRTEWRLYFKDNAVMQAAAIGDLLVVGRRANGEILFLVAPDGSTLENQIAWLFGLDGALGAGFRFEGFEGASDRGLDFVSRYVLEELGVEPEEPDTDRFDNLIERFGVTFPTSREFSVLARLHADAPDPRDDPDGALLGWLEFEDALFRRLERHVVSARLQNGFITTGQADVDGFLQFSLSVQNRRKSRMGLSFENHVEAALIQLSIKHERGARTEGNSKPDFLFPGAGHYLDSKFDAQHLTMLGVKSTLKDRWRQVLAEAQRIDRKHLLTLEPGISVSQTDEMMRQSLQLVVPTQLHPTFTPKQAAWLLSFGDFVSVVRSRQVAAGVA
jgi:EcoRII C terminal